MKTYYEIFGVKKDATSKEIEQVFNHYKSTNSITVELSNIYNILSDYHSRRKYDENLEKRQKLFSIKIPFFGYDFDEKYVQSYASYEKKRFFIDKNRYLIYEKHNKNGHTYKKYYVENNGKIEELSDESIKKIKEEYLEKNSPTNLLKDSPRYRVLPK